MIERHSLRFRMMALFCVVVGILLAGSYLAFYIVLRREVQMQLDRQLIETSRPIVADIAGDADQSDVAELDIPDEYFEVLDAAGRVVAHSQNLGSEFLALSTLPRDLSSATFQTVEDAVRGRLRLVLIPFRSQAANYVFLLAISTRHSDQALLTFRHMGYSLLPLSLLLTGMVSTWFVGRSLGPIAELTRQAQAMIGHVTDGKRREVWQPLVTPHAHDELGQLAGTFNQLFASLDSVLQQMRQFVSDASHELRTPLSVLRGETELMLSEPRTIYEYQATLRSTEDELKKLSRIVEGLFTLAMADAGQLRLARAPLYLNEVLEESCALATPFARAKGISIERELSAEVFDIGDEPFFRQLFLIFLDNAVKYSPAHRHIHVRLETSDGLARATFQDEGIGIADEHVPHIFERFYRASPHSSEEAQSGGLGLAIAEAIVRAEGGSIACRTTPGEGTTFTIDLPIRNHQPLSSSKSE